MTTSRSELSRYRWLDELDTEPQAMQDFFVMVALAIGAPQMDYRGLAWQVEFNKLAIASELFVADASLGKLAQRYARWYLLNVK